MLETWEEAERKLRRKMRMFPGLTKSRHPEPMPLQQRDSQNRESQNEERHAEQRRYEDARRKAIVSVYGRDLLSEDHIAGVPSAKSRPRKKNAA